MYIYIYTYIYIYICVIHLRQKSFNGCCVCLSTRASGVSWSWIPFLGGRSSRPRQNHPETGDFTCRLMEKPCVLQLKKNNLCLWISPYVLFPNFHCGHHTRYDPLVLDGWSIGNFLQPRHCMVHNMPQTLPPDQQRSFQDSDGVFPKLATSGD